MKLRSVVVVMSAALIGAGAPGFAQAARSDGHGGASRYDVDQHRDRGHRGGSGSNLGLALGIGLLGALVASQMNDQPYYQQPDEYAPSYPPADYGPGAYGYPQRYQRYDYPNENYPRGIPRTNINPMTGY